MFVYQKYGTLGSFNHWTLDLYGPCGDGHVGRKFKSSKMICKWWCEMRACGVKVGGLSCFLIFCHLLIDAMLITFCYHSSSWWLFQKSYYSRKGVHISNTSLALLADESTFTFPSKIWGQAKATVAPLRRFCASHTCLKGRVCVGPGDPFLSSMMLHVFPKQISQLQIFICGVFTFLLNMETLLRGIPRILPVSKVTAGPKIKKRRCASSNCETSSFDKIIWSWPRSMVEGLRISKRQRNGINICRKHLGCINFGHPFLSKLFLKVPKHWRKNCGSNRTAYFFLLDPWVFSFNLTRYVFREVNHLVIGFHDWTKHQTWVCTNPLDKNWISSRQIWSLGHVEIHAIMVGHPKSKWSKTFPHP